MSVFIALTKVSLLVSSGHFLPIEVGCWSFSAFFLHRHCLQILFSVILCLSLLCFFLLYLAVCHIFATSFKGDYGSE